MKKFRFLILFSGFLIYSFSGVVAKSSSAADLFSWSTLIRFLGVLALLGIYSAFWQVSLKYIPLSTAFLCKGSVVVFSLIWAVIIFGEKITTTNLLGATLIIIGILVMAHERKAA